MKPQPMTPLFWHQLGIPAWRPISASPKGGRLAYLTGQNALVHWLDASQSLNVSSRLFLAKVSQAMGYAQLADAKSSYTCERLVLWGESARASFEPAKDLPMNTWQSVDIDGQSVAVCVTLNLQGMMNDPEIKKAFWQSFLLHQQEMNLR